MGRLKERDLMPELVSNGLPFWQFYDVQVLEIQIRGWIVCLQTEGTNGQSCLFAGVGAFGATVGVIAYLNTIDPNRNVTTTSQNRLAEKFTVVRNHKPGWLKMARRPSGFTFRLRNSIFLSLLYCNPM